MDFLPGLLRDAREWLPTSIQFANAGTTALMTLALLTVLERAYRAVYRAEAKAAALVVKDAHTTAAAEAAELLATRLQAETDKAAERIRAEAALAADVVLAAAELARDTARRQ